MTDSPLADRPKVEGLLGVADDPSTQWIVLVFVTSGLPLKLKGGYPIPIVFCPPGGVFCVGWG
jgi:hypothetical protein